MYLLDTHVISEIRKINCGRGDENVKEWLRGVNSSSFFVSVLTVAEIEGGILSVSRRDTQQGKILQTWLNQVVLPFFATRVVSFDLEAALIFAELSVSDRDAMIAATALRRSLTLVTKNEEGFQIPKLKLFNPWQS